MPLLGRTVQYRSVWGGETGTELAKDLEPGIKLGSPGAHLYHVSALRTRLSVQTESDYHDEPAWWVGKRANYAAGLLMSGTNGTVVTGIPAIGRQSIGHHV